MKISTSKILLKIEDQKFRSCEVQKQDLVSYLYNLKFLDAAHSFSIGNEFENSSTSAGSKSITRSISFVSLGSPYIMLAVAPVTIYRTPSLLNRLIKIRCKLGSGIQENLVDFFLDFFFAPLRVLLFQCSCFESLGRMV